jgi:hypothetical protein
MLIIFGLSSWTSFTTSAHPQTARPAGDRVAIQRRRIVLVRPPAVAKQFPSRKTAVVVYPVISGLSDPAVLKKVRNAISFKNLFDYSLDEYRNDSWLSEFSYVVNYNQNYLLDLTFTQSGVAAYPDDQSKHVLIDLRDGHIIKAAEVFDAAKLDALAERVNDQLQREIANLVKENIEPTDSAEQKESVKEAYENLKFETANLDEFMVGPKGITFLYDAGFPHVIQALEPDGKYFFSYAALNAYIKRDGLLGRFKG